MAGDGKKLSEGLADQIARTPDGPHRRHLEELYRQSIYGNAVDPVPGAIAQFGGGSKTASIFEKALGVLTSLVSENPSDKDVLYAVTPWAAKSPEIRKRLAKRLGYDPHETTYTRYQQEPDVPKTKGGRGGIFFTPLEDRSNTYKVAPGGVVPSYGREGGPHKALAQIKPVNPYVAITRTRSDAPPDYLADLLSKFIGENETRKIRSAISNALWGDASEALTNQPAVTKYLNRSDIRDILESAKPDNPNRNNLMEHVLAKIMHKQGYDASLTPRQAFMFDSDLYKIVSGKTKSLEKKPPEQLSQSAKTLLSTQRGKGSFREDILNEKFNINDYDLKDNFEAAEFQKNLLKTAAQPLTLLNPAHYNKIQKTLQDFGKVADVYGPAGYENLKTLLGASSILQTYDKLKSLGTPNTTDILKVMIEDANAPKTIDAVKAVLDSSDISKAAKDYYQKLLQEKSAQVSGTLNKLDK